MIYARKHSSKQSKKDRFREYLAAAKADGRYDALLRESLEFARNKAAFFGRSDANAEKEAQRRTEKLLREEMLRQSSGEEKDLFVCAEELLSRPAFCIFSFVFSLPAWVIFFIFSHPYCKYICDRLCMMLLVLAGIVVLVFSIIYISPNDPALAVMGQDATPEAIASFNRSYGLDQPYLAQLWRYIRNIFTFNLDKSFVGADDILDSISRKLPATVAFGIGSFFVCLFIGLPAGIISAMKQNTITDYGLMFVALLGLSIPNFWLGMVLILTFGIRLRWIPVSYVIGSWISLILPSIVIGTGNSASLARNTRASMLDVMRSDYVTMARAKGLKERKVIFRHILKTALIPVIGVLGSMVLSVFNGAASTEKVFTISGIGTYLTNATMLPDTPVLIATVVYLSALSSFGLLVMDILYTFADPRLKTRLKDY